MKLSDFTTYVLTYFKRTDKNAELVQAYNDMISYIAIQIPNAAYKFQSWVPTVIGQVDYPLPPNIIHLIHPIKLIEGWNNADSGLPLKFIPKHIYDAYEPNPYRINPSTSKPWGYTVYGNEILLTPVPDKVYYIEINWTKAPVAQAGQNDTPDLPVQFDEIILWGTLERLYAGIGMYEESQFWGAKYHDQRGDPIGPLSRLLELEKDHEGGWIGLTRSNWL